MQHRRNGLRLAALVAAALLVGACSNTGTDSAPAASPTSAEASVSPSAAGSVATHNDADVRFAQGMIPHHLQAIEMSDILLGKQGIDRGCVAGKRDQERAGSRDRANAGMAPGVGSLFHTYAERHWHARPGHARTSDAWYEWRARHDVGCRYGRAAERAGRRGQPAFFLMQMIEHHKGAIMMAQQEIDNGQFPPAAMEMARNIVSSQQAEIDTMQGMLDK